MPTNPCCEQWLMTLEPSSAREGRFREKRQCPTCKTLYSVEFQCGAMLGGDLTCAAVAATPIE
jgi:hypothetical protein